MSSPAPLLLTNSENQPLSTGTVNILRRSESKQQGYHFLLQPICAISIGILGDLYITIYPILWLVRRLEIRLPRIRDARAYAGAITLRDILRDMHMELASLTKAPSLMAGGCCTRFAMFDDTLST